MQEPATKLTIIVLLYRFRNAFLWFEIDRQRSASGHHGIRIGFGLE
jgi:hypothetical protein